MSKKAKKRRNPSGRRHRRHSFGSKRRSVRRSRNPLSVGGMNVGHLVKLSAGAAGGVIGAQFLTNLVLKGKNTGLIGYGTQAAFAIALGWGTGYVLKDKEIGEAVSLGGISALILRVLQEKVPSIFPSLSGYQDMGDFINANFVAPPGMLPSGMASSLSLPAAPMAVSGGGPTAAGPAVLPNRWATRYAGGV